MNKETFESNSRLKEASIKKGLFEKLKRQGKLEWVFGKREIKYIVR